MNKQFAMLKGKEDARKNKYDIYAVPYMLMRWYDIGYNSWRKK